MDENRSRPHWICKCSCGRTEEFSVRADSLKANKEICCQKCRDERSGFKKTIDLTGMIFGKLLVVERDAEKVGRGAFWKCKCSCDKNTIISVASKHLISGSTVSCGCLSESIIATELKEYFFNFYDAIKEYSPIRNPVTNSLLYYDIFIPKIS